MTKAKNGRVKYAKVLQGEQRNGTPAAAEDNGQVETPAASKKKGRDPKMNGHTIYFHDDEFELIVLEAMRRKQTISEYVVWGLRAAPHQLLSVHKDTPKAKPAPQEEQPPSEAPDDDQAGASLANTNGHG
jgi:hypothetical protein